MDRKSADCLHSAGIRMQRQALMAIFVLSASFSTPLIMSSTPLISSVPVTSSIPPKTSPQGYKHDAQ